jgi:hypothetical protein
MLTLKRASECRGHDEDIEREREVLKSLCGLRASLASMEVRNTTVMQQSTIFLTRVPIISVGNDYPVAHSYDL